MGKFKDLTGERFGMLTVIKQGSKDKNKKINWYCVCDCGTKKEFSGNSIRRGITRSCGCYDYINDQSKHNMRDKPEYRIWRAMRTRCNNPKSNRYDIYGGKGIQVCERWNRFINFYKDMGPRPTDKHSIDRIDSDGNYEPDNCRWADGVTQSRNQGIRKDNKSGVRGVYWTKKNKKWLVNIKNDGKTIYLGYYINFEEAVKVRVEAEEKYWSRKKE